MRSGLGAFLAAENAEDRRDLASGLLDVCEITGLYLRLPGQGLVTCLADGSLGEGVAGLCSLLEGHGVPTAGVLAEMQAARSDAASSLDGLRCDYTCLLAHPKHPKVARYESHFLVGEGADLPLLAVNRTALDLDGAYLRQGFARADGGYVPGDAIEMELDYLALLLGRVLEGAPGADDAAAAVRELYDKHGSRWWGEFFDALHQGAQTAAYRAAALLGKAAFA